MALFASTTADTVEYVSRKDPARGDHKPVWVDEKDKSKGEVLTSADIQKFRENGATIFVLKPLDVYLMGTIYDNASVLRGSQDSETIDIHTKTNATNIDAVKYGCVGFENFRVKGDGNPTLKYESEEVMLAGREYRVMKPHLLTAIRDITLIAELADRIKKISEVDTDEEKNSGYRSLPGD
jgi:hypothetical protein